MMLLLLREKGSTVTHCKEKKLTQCKPTQNTSHVPPKIPPHTPHPPSVPACGGDEETRHSRDGEGSRVCRPHNSGQDARLRAQSDKLPASPPAAAPPRRRPFGAASGYGGRSGASPFRLRPPSQREANVRPPLRGTEKNKASLCFTESEPKATWTLSRSDWGSAAARTAAKKTMAARAIASTNPLRQPVE